MKMIIGIIVSVVVLVVLVGGTAWNCIGTEVSLRNQFNAQLDVNEASFDKTWKIIQQNSQVTQKERETFAKTYTEIMEAKQGIAGNGSLASFLTESKVELSDDAYLRLMSTIESQRESFFRDQKKLAQIKQQHDNSRTTPVMKIFNGGKPELEMIIVSSDKSKEALTTGQENDVDLFN